MGAVIGLPLPRSAPTNQPSLRERIKQSLPWLNIEHFPHRDADGVARSKRIVSGEGG